MWRIKFPHIKCRRGFTLLEVLIALIVASLFLTLLVPVALSSLKRIALSTNKNRALFLAQSELELYSMQPNISTGVIRGKEGDLSWELDVDTLQESNTSETGIVLRKLRIKVTQDHDPLPLVEISARRLFPLR